MCFSQQRAKLKPRVGGAEKSTGEPGVTCVSFWNKLRADENDWDKQTTYHWISVEFASLLLYVSSDASRQHSVRTPPDKHRPTFLHQQYSPVYHDLNYCHRDWSNKHHVWHVKCTWAETCLSAGECTECDMWNVDEQRPVSQPVNVPSETCET